ncbi:choline-sulfatase [Chromatiales bacterium (ex Bugula neritina AB1)]|nr:choline-sulfatase [Chromatiales bacterium (ex Bugula neritina AB1)]
MSSSKPNIVLVMADQLTAFALSSYGNTVTKTPHIDSFAEKATVFENAYCSYPLCAPSRFALMSGRLPSKIAAYDNAAEFPASIPTIAHYLRDAGYYTCLSGKMHFVGPDQHHGYEARLTTEIYPADFSWTPPETYETQTDPEQSQSEGPAPGVSSVDTITDAGPKVRSMQMDYDDEVIHRACQHLFDRNRHGDSRPLFLTVSFTQPHDPYVSRKEFWDLYSDQDIDLPRVPPIPLDEMDEHSRSLYYHYGLNKFDVTEPIYRRARHGYYAMISDIDQKIGKLLRTLTECGMDDNTAIVFTSDHGDMIGERGLWFKKNLFDPAIRVPLMLRWPGKALPARVVTPSSLLDILPTVAALAGIPEHVIATRFEGRSLLQRIRGDTASQSVYAEHLDGGTRAPRVMLRKGDLKIVHSLEYPTQLYNLADDTNERVNLAQHPDWKTTTETLLNQVNSMWDLPQLKTRVMRNQRIRQLLMRSLGKGEKRNWEHYPDPQRSGTRWVREGDYFPEVEQRGYISYPSE